METVKPYGEQELKNLALQVASNPTCRPQIPAHVKVLPEHCKLIKLMQKCWQHKAHKRPSFEVICAKLNKIMEEGVPISHKELK